MTPQIQLPYIIVWVYFHSTVCLDAISLSIYVIDSLCSDWILSYLLIIILLCM